MDLDFAKVMGGRDRRDLVCVYELRANGRRLSSGVVGFVPIKHLKLSDPGLTAKVRPAGDQWAVTVKAKSLARFVRLSLAERDVVWSDNWFDLPAGESRTVTCPRRSGHTAAKVKAGLRLAHLYASYA